MTRVERQPLLGPRRRKQESRSGLAGAARVVAALGLTVLSGLVVVAVASQAVGYSAHVVTSGSMTPRVEPGDVVLTRATTTAELRPGQVLLFADPDRPGGLLLHRLVSFDPAGKLVTRGDANQSDDSVHVASSAVRGVARMRVPWVGLPAVWRAQGRFGLIALAAALLAGVAVFVSQALARRDAVPSSVGAVHDSRAAACPPMTAAQRSAVIRTADRPGTTATEEKRGSASTAGYVLPPVPGPVPRRAGAADRAGSGLRPAGDHSACVDGGRFCGQPRR